MSAPFVSGEHVAHGVAPTCLAHETDRAASGREQCVGGLTLTEYGIGCGDAHVSGEEEFVAGELGGAMHRGYDWFRSKWWDGAEGVNKIRGVRVERTCAQHRPPSRRVHA